MKQFEFNYTKNFSCINSKCKHNCCVGWKIKVDKSSLKNYATLSEKDIRFEGNITNDNFFNLDKELRCPFLDKDNLCHIIKNYGEKFLCKTCKTHPRFKNFFSDRVETGLGLYCEEACRLILTNKKKMKVVVNKDDNKNTCLRKFEKQIFSFRNKVIKIAQNRKLTIQERLEQLKVLSDIDIDKLSFDKWKNIFCSLEKLSVNEYSFNDLQNSPNFSSVDQNFSSEYEQLLCYLAFRHISRAFDLLDLRIRLAFVILCFKMISHIFNTLKEKDLSSLIEVCRFFTSEIECSDKNQNQLLNQIELLVCYK